MDSLKWWLRTYYHFGYLCGELRETEIEFFLTLCGMGFGVRNNDVNKDCVLVSQLQFTVTYYVWATSRMMAKNIFALHICMTVLHSFSLKLYFLLHVSTLFLMKPLADAQSTLWKRGDCKILRASHRGGGLEVIERMWLTIVPPAGFIRALGGPSFLFLS